MATVLFVDDEMSRSKVLELGLRLEGIEVLTAKTAPEVLRTLETHSVDLAVIDLMMPGTNGLELARVLRHRHPRVRVVLTSAYHLSERQLERADCGVVGFVPKPFEVGDLIAFLRTKVSSPPPGATLRFAAG